MPRFSSILIVLLCLSPTMAQERNDPENAYFGDLHVHTRDSLDAYNFNTRATPDQAYNFARGEVLKSPTILRVQLEVPLDFAAVTDHAEYLGIVANIIDPRFDTYYSELAQRLRDGERAEGEDPHAIYLFKDDSPLTKLLDSPETRTGAALLWSEQMATADRHNQADDFTAFIAYEWTSGLQDNLHRNVIFRSKGPPLPWGSFRYSTPEALWTQMTHFRELGFDSIAIPHNANLSAGKMYANTMSNGEPIDALYAERRGINEPLAEIVQTKGASETNLLAADEEFVNPADDFELQPPGQRLLGPPVDDPYATVPFSYLRSALQLGLKHEQEIGVNPFKQGFVGGTDTHNGTPGYTVESTYRGHHGTDDNTAELRLGLIDATGPAPGEGNLMNNPGGLTGIWATENSRDALFESMRRRETFATSGVRIRIRFFGGWNLDPATDRKPNMVAYCYREGVPMGADLPTRPGDAKPVFAVWAMRDPNSARLERIQIIKGWLAAGEPREAVYDIQVKEGTGAAELSATWTDPDFDPQQRAFYYARVLERPTPRWSTYDAKTLYEREELVPKDRPLADVAKTIQERAWSSSIWYSPAQ